MRYEIVELDCDTKHGAKQVSEVLAVSEIDAGDNVALQTCAEPAIVKPLGIMGELEAGVLLLARIHPDDSVWYVYPSKTVKQDYAAFMADMQEQWRFEHGVGEAG